MRYIKVNLKRFDGFNDLPAGVYIINVKAIGTGNTYTNSNISSGTTCVKQ